MSDRHLIEELDKIDIPIHEQVNAIFAGTQALLQAAVPIRNVIMAIGEHRTGLEDALAGTYFRMCLIMESLTRLNKRQDFQVALHCARCLYELYLDVVDLVNDPSLVASFQAFTFVARFAAAEKLVAELTSQGIVDPTINRHERQFIADPIRRAKFDSERRAHWPHPSGAPITPLNWRNQKLPIRASNIGPNELLRYRRLYAYLCWYSHSGMVGIAGISPEGLESGMGIAHAHSQDFFFESTNLIAATFDIYKANPTLKVPIDQYRQTTAKAIVSYVRRLQSIVK